MFSSKNIGYWRVFYRMMWIKVPKRSILKVSGKYDSESSAHTEYSDRSPSSPSPRPASSPPDPL